MAENRSDCCWSSSVSWFGRDESLKKLIKHNYKLLLGGDPSDERSFIGKPHVHQHAEVAVVLDSITAHFTKRKIFRNGRVHKALGHIKLLSCFFDRVDFIGLAGDVGAGVGSSTFDRCFFVGCSFTSVTLSTCTFNTCFFENCTFDGSVVFQVVQFQHCQGLDYVSGLGEVVIAEPQRDHLIIWPPLPLRGYRWTERWASWEFLGVAGRLPLFGLSTTALLVIPLLTWVIDLYNNQTGHLRQWVAGHAQDLQAVPALAQAVERIQPILMPSLTLWTLIATFLLGVASALYTLCCPSRIREFTSDRWIDELRQHPIRYLPLSWERQRLRLIIAGCYLVGGGLSLLILLYKLAGAAWHIIKVTTHPWLP
jgi:hypothetical protein